MAGCYRFESILPRVRRSNLGPAGSKALGSRSLPETVAIGGVAHRLRETFKHDSWAATGLYEGPSGVLRVVKLHRQAPVFGIPMGWLGRRMARHEIQLLSALADLKGLPALAGQVSSEGRVLRNAVARELHRRPPARQPRGRERIVLPSASCTCSGRCTNEKSFTSTCTSAKTSSSMKRGEPCLIDFQISLAWPRWLPAGPALRANAPRAMNTT